LSGEGAKEKINRLEPERSRDGLKLHLNRCRTPSVSAGGGARLGAAWRRFQLGFWEGGVREGGGLYRREGSDEIGTESPD
jgi:hypothetical protein